MFSKTSKFFGEIRAELVKVQWPWDPKEKGVKRYRELVDSTLVVVIATVLLSGFIALSDFFIVHVVAWITSL